VGDDLEWFPCPTCNGEGGSNAGPLPDPEAQVNELVRELQYIVDSKGFTQLSHAKQEHVRRAIKTRGVKDR
jgi:hypothetical protein